MGSPWALLSSVTLVFVVLSSACEDGELCEQREITFDHDKILQVPQDPDPFMLQSEVDLSDLFVSEVSLDPDPSMVQSEMDLSQNPDPSMVQSEMDLSDLLASEDFPIKQVDDSELEQRLIGIENPRPGMFAPRGRQPSFGPRSFGGPPVLNYRVQFPLGRPTSENLHAICLHGDRRPTYPDSYFPASGFGQQRRRASAVNRAESWFTTCCSQNQTWGTEVTLCCATQAWELSVQTFCEEDSSVKDRLYGCCRLTGGNRLKCFNKDAPNPNYEPTEELPVSQHSSTDSFSFDPSTCKRKMMTPYRVKENRRKKMKKQPTFKKVNMNFPPGRPTEHVIASLCRNQKQRPLFNTKCLPGSGYELVALQAKTINRIEQGFKQCCKQKWNILNCAERKWRDELDKFCLGGNGERVDYHCCSAGGQTDDNYRCFQNASADQYYNVTAASKELSLQNICRTHKIIKKKFPLGLPINNVVQCCLLQDNDRSSCLDKRLKSMASNLCASKKRASVTSRQCCRESSPHDAPECISDILVAAINKAAKIQQKKRRRCPLS